MARRGSEGGGGISAPVIGVAINLLVFVVLIIFAPTIAGTIEESRVDLDESCQYIVWGGTVFGNASQAIGDCNTVNATDGKTYNNESAEGWNDWNVTAHPELGGANIWTMVIDVIAVGFLVVAVAIAIFYLKGM